MILVLSLPCPMFHEPIERASEIATPKRPNRPKIFCCQNLQYSSQNGESQNGERTPPHKGMINQKSLLQKNQHQVEIAGVMKYHLSTRHYVQGEILPQHYWLHFHTFKNCWIPSKMDGISIIPGWFLFRQTSTQSDSGCTTQQRSSPAFGAFGGTFTLRFCSMDTAYGYRNPHPPKAAL